MEAPGHCQEILAVPGASIESQAKSALLPPPSTFRFCLVTQQLSSLARNTTDGAMSSERLSISAVTWSVIPAGLQHTRLQWEYCLLFPVRRACAFIHDHLFLSFDLEELAAYSRCSLSYLRHLFKKETGVPLVQYIQIQYKRRGL